MTRRTLALAVLAGAAAQANAQMDYTFELVSTEDISVIMSDSANPFFIGNNASAIAYDGTNLYVGGYDNSQDVTQVQITQIQDFLLGDMGRSFARVFGSEADSITFRGYTGLAWDDDRGLLATIDQGNSSEVDQIRIFNVKVPTAMNPMPRDLDLKSASFEYRGIAGPAWDYGADGMGFDYDNDGNVDGPVAAVLDPFFDAADVTVKEGPFGFVPPEEPASGATFEDIFELVYERDDVPIALGGRSTLYRDIDIDPRNGQIAYRAGNALVVVDRDPAGLNNWETEPEDEPTQLLAPDNAAGVGGQNVHLIWGLDNGMPDAVIWNDRPNFASDTFANRVNINEVTGPAGNLNIVDSAGNPVAIADGNGYYDFEWHQESQTLLICDFNLRLVYVLRPFSGADCPPDLNDDGFLNNGDINLFVSSFLAGQPLGDYNGDGNFNNTDINNFVSDFLAGCG